MDPLEVLERQIEANRSLTGEIAELRTVIQVLNGTLANGALKSIARKADRTFIAVAVLLVPLVGLLIRAMV